MRWPQRGCTGRWSHSGGGGGGGGASHHRDPFDFFPSSFVVTDCAKPQPDQSQAQQRYQPHATFVPLGPDRAAGTFSLQVGSGETFEQVVEI